MSATLLWGWMPTLSASNRTMVVQTCFRFGLPVHYQLLFNISNNTTRTEYGPYDYGFKRMNNVIFFFFCTTLRELGSERVLCAEDRSDRRIKRSGIVSNKQNPEVKSVRFLCARAVMTENGSWARTGGSARDVAISI